jgi:methionyl-tRNA formyltransferase
MNIVLIGEESAGVRTLASLKQSSHRLVAVLASPNNTTSTGASVWNAACNLGVETWPAQLVGDPQFAEKLRAEKVEIILNVHSLYIIHRSVLAAPSIGAFNLHPGPLPRYAGLNAISWAIYRGETTHGVTLHKMVPEIDAGPIVYQARFPLEDGDSAFSLSRKCVSEGLALIQQFLEVAALDPLQIPLTPQDLQAREYFGKEVPEGGRLSWCWAAAKVVNFVRACDYFPFYSPWGHPLTSVGDTQIAIVKAARTGTRCSVAPGTVGETSGSEVLIACGDEWALVKKLKVGKDYVKPTTVLCSGQQLETHASLGSRGAG